MSQDNGAQESTTPRGEELATEFLAVANEVATDLVKFFDKGQKVAARRCRKDLSALAKFAKEVRKEISAVKNERSAVASE